LGVLFEKTLYPPGDHRFPKNLDTPQNVVARSVTWSKFHTEKHKFWAYP